MFCPLPKTKTPTSDNPFCSSEMNFAPSSAAHTQLAFDLDFLFVLACLEADTGAMPTMKEVGPMRITNTVVDVLACTEADVGVMPMMKEAGPMRTGSARPVTTGRRSQVGCGPAVRDRR